MKTWIAIFAFLFVHAAFAADVATSGMTVSAAAPQTTSSSLSDLSYLYSSINRGTSYLGVGLMNEWNSGIGLGARAYMPLAFDKDSQVYMAQVYLRVLFLNEINQMYLEPAYTQSFFNSAGDDLQAFGMFGVTYGFNHQFNKQFMLGASLGVDYSTAAIKDNEYRSGASTFTNKIALIGGYYF